MGSSGQLLRAVDDETGQLHRDGRENLPEMQPIVAFRSKMRYLWQWICKTSEGIQRVQEFAAAL